MHGDMHHARAGQELKQASHAASWSVKLRPMQLAVWYTKADVKVAVGPEHTTHCCDPRYRTYWQSMQACLCQAHTANTLVHHRIRWSWKMGWVTETHNGLVGNLDVICKRCSLL